MKFKAIAATITCACLLSACAGKSYVDTFEPVIDRQDVDAAHYQRDLADCRSYAVKEDPANKAANEALAGALVGALVGAAVGGAYHQAGAGAAYGATYGTVAGGTHGALSGMQAQQIIVTRCMAGRGYKVLYGGDLAP